MFKGLQAASARFNLRSTMDRLNGKMGAGAGNVLDATMASKDIIKGLLIDLTFLVDNWNPEVKDLPPEKVIRDFNIFLFSGKYDLFVTDTLANTISHLGDKKIETFSSLLNYYFSTYGEKDCKEKKVIQNFVNEIIKGLERQSRDRKIEQGCLRNFINNQTIKWSLDDDLTKKEIEESLNEALNKRNNNASAIIESVNKKIELKQFQEGIIQANKGLEIHKDNLLLYVARARCFYESGYMESAINDFTKSIELDNDLNNSIFHKYRGLAKLQINDKEGALNDFKIAAGRGNDDAKELLNIYFKNKDNFSSDKKVSTEKEKELDKEIPGFEKRVEGKEIKMDEHEYYTRAFEKHKLEDFQGAIADYSKSLEIDPRNYAVFYNRAESKREIQDDSGAIADYTKALEINPRMSQAYNNRGFVKAKLGDFKGAIDDYSKSLEINPRNQNAYLNRGIEKDQLGDFQGAINDYTKAIEINPKDQNAYLNRGIEKHKLEDFKGAIVDYSKAIEINPSFANAFFNRAVSKKKIEDFQGAIDDYKKAIEINPKDQLANQKLKEIEKYLREKASSKSINDNKKETEINPKNAEAEAYHNLGVAKFRLEDFQGAIDNYTKAIEINPSYKEAYYNLGIAKVRLEDFQGAINNYTKAIEINPSYADAYTFRGIIKGQLKDFDGAIADLNNAIEINPTDANSYQIRGELKWNFAVEVDDDDEKEIQLIVESVLDYKKALELGDESAQQQLNELEAALRKVAKSDSEYAEECAKFLKEHFNKEISLKEDNLNDAEKYCERGFEKLQLEDFEGAIDNYTRAIEINPNFADAYYDRGSLKAQLEDHKGAIADLTKVIEINPKDIEAYHKRGNTKGKLGDYQGAIDDHTKAIELNPSDDSYYKRALAKVVSEDNEGAISDFNKAIEINPNFADAYYFRGSLKSQLKDHEEALSDFNKAIEINPSFANAYFSLGITKGKLEDYEGKIADLKKAKELGSEDAKKALKQIEESLRKIVSSNSEEANNAAIFLKEYFDRDNQLRPISTSAIQNVLETKLDNFNPTYKTWATFKALKRLAWVMEDDGSDEEELYSFLLSSYKNVSSPEKFTEWIKELLYDNSYSNNDPEWLESEWNIGPDVELHAFNSTESFLKSFNSEYTYSIFSKCWEIACSEDLYKLNDYENWNKKKYWFFKNKIWIITSEQVNKYYLKKDVLKKFLDASQLESFYNYEIGNGISVLEISGVKEVGEKLNWMDKRDLIKFHELPLELLDNLEQRPTSEEDSNGEGYTKNSTGELIHESDPVNIFTSNNSGDRHLTRVNNLLLKFWEFTPFYEKETIPIVLVSKGEDNSVNFSYSRGTKDNPLPPASCFYSIFDDGKVKVKETNEVLNLNDFSHLMAIISTIIRDIYGDYDSEGVTLKFMESITLGKDNFNNFDEKEENKNLEKDNFELEIAPLGVLPGGYYWIGDPANIEDNVLNELNAKNTKGGCFYLKEGIACAFFETAVGDGVFEDQKSNQYLVDSGRIACIPIGKVPEDADELGHIFHITNPFVCQYIDNGGFICFGEIVIKTNIINECSFPEPLKIEELGALNYGEYLYENDSGNPDSWAKWASNIKEEKIEEQSFKAAVEMYAKVKNSEISPESAFNLIVDKYGEKCSSNSFMAIYSSLDNQSKSKEIDLSEAVSSQKDVVMEFLNKNYSKEYINEIINDKNKTSEEIEEYLFKIWLERNNSLVKNLSAWVEHKVFVHKNS